MTDLYNDGTPPTTDTTTTAAPTLTLPDEVAALVGPGKKYATLELALKSIAPAQDHIARLEAEAVDLRKKAETGVTTATVYETVQELLKAQEKPSAVAGLDEAAVASLFDRLSDQRSQAQKESDNVTSFKSVFDKQFGEKAKDTFAAKATEVGLSVTQLSALVKSSPEAALRLVGLKAPAPVTGAKLTTSVNTETFDHNQRPSEVKRNLISGGAKRGELKAEWAEITKAVNERNGIQ